MSRVSRKESNADMAEFSNSMELVQKLEAGNSALKARDLAQLFGVTQQHIYKLAAQGVIPSFRIGAAVRFDPATIAEWLRRKTAPGRAAVSAIKIAV